MTTTGTIDYILERAEHFRTVLDKALNDTESADVAFYAAGYRNALLDVLEAMRGEADDEAEPE
jgi:dsDNA-binding SOS-regulon protein